MAFPKIPQFGSIVPGEQSSWDAVYHTDFMAINVDASYTYGADAPQAQEWLYTETDTDTDNAGRCQIHDDFDPGGWLKLTRNDNASDVGSVQLIGSQVRLVPGKDIYFTCRFAAEDVSTTNAFVGLATPASANGYVGVNDSIGFRLAAGNLNYVTEDDTNETTADTGIDAADATGREQAIDGAFWVKYPEGGSPKVRFYAFGGSGTTQSYDSNWIATNIPDDDTDLALIITNDAASAGAHAVYVDSVFVGQKR